jgi:hypothetical protein
VLDLYLTAFTIFPDSGNFSNEAKIRLRIDAPTVDPKKSYTGPLGVAAMPSRSDFGCGP